MWKDTFSTAKLVWTSHWILKYYIVFLFGECVETIVYRVFLPGAVNPCVPNPCGEASCVAEDGVALCQGESQITHFSLFTGLLTSDVQVLQIKFFMFPQFLWLYSCLCSVHVTWFHHVWLLTESCCPLWFLFPVFPAALLCWLSCIQLWRFPCRSCIGSLSVCVADEMLGMPWGCSATVSHLCCPLCCWFAVLPAALCMRSSSSSSQWRSLMLPILRSSFFISDPWLLATIYLLQPLLIKHNWVLCCHTNLHTTLTPSAWPQQAFCNTWLHPFPHLLLTP